jgi:hypothetical protein
MLHCRNYAKGSGLQKQQFSVWTAHRFGAATQGAAPSRIVVQAAGGSKIA